MFPFDYTTIDVQQVTQPTQSNPTKNPYQYQQSSYYTQPCTHHSHQIHGSAQMPVQYHQYTPDPENARLAPAQSLVLKQENDDRLMDLCASFEIMNYHHPQNIQHSHPVQHPPYHPQNQYNCYNEYQHTQHLHHNTNNDYYTNKHHFFENNHGTHSTENENTSMYKTPPLIPSKPYNIQLHHSPSTCNISHDEGPHTPSTDTYTNHDYDTDHSDETQAQNEVNEELMIMNDHNALLQWMNNINGVINIPSTEYEFIQSLCGYNEITGGVCFELEQESKHNTTNINIDRCEFDSYVNHINKRIFYLNEAIFYEHILMYLDAKSIFNGLMTTCKKLHYFKFIDIDESNVWNKLLIRDFPKLFDENYMFYVPYTCNLESFERHILKRREEKRLYFAKIQNDRFWKLLFNIKRLDLRMNNEELAAKWTRFSWYKLLLGMDDDGGFNVYKRLIRLKHHPYIVAFGDDILPDDDVMDRFCNAVRKHMICCSQQIIIYLNPWISPTQMVEWKRGNRTILWCNEYKQCWGLPQSEDDAYYGSIKRIPAIIQLIGTLQFQGGKTYKPEDDWLPFLQSFDASLCSVSEIRNLCWFQKQFMLIEMENRLKNVRSLIEIVRTRY